MGLFSFIKEAGAKVFGIGKTEEEKNNEAIKSMRSTISNLDLQVKDLEINIDDETAILSGMAKDQATKEKVVLVVGNSSGIAQVQDNMQVEPQPVEVKQAPQSRFHTVERGDTLSKIAKNVYGDAMKYPVIFEANKPMLSDPDKIYPGQVLRIPHLEG